MLDALHIEHLELEGYEADDIIATLATQAVDAGFDVLILTGDRDSLQLVTDRAPCSTRCAACPSWPG